MTDEPTPQQLIRDLDQHLLSISQNIGTLADAYNRMYERLTKIEKTVNTHPANVEYTYQEYEK